ncbi:MAG: hypothetical protein QG615_1883, partial [Nitrospirota bacterium]|nr:hypothetical protein [Nitrospirota bacterium]
EAKSNEFGLWRLTLLGLGPIISPHLVRSPDMSSQTVSKGE